ncbi:MAG: ABC transporter ATP-binding protein [Eubacterium sp.]|nr:ABC transporter ATP-binding protein [Eubacterium sp.]
MNYAIEIKNLTKHYKDFSLKDVSFSLPAGSIMGFIGENGAGKTTVIKAILNLIHRDGGSICVLGQDNVAGEGHFKARTGVVLADQSFPPDFSPKDLNAIMKNIYPSWDSALFFDHCARFGLPKDKKIKVFSKGMKMKLFIITALAHRPELLILDEATTGLDPIVRSEILDLFQAFIADEGHSILISSHITSDLEKIADYITFIHQGKILCSETKDDLIEGHGLLKCSAQQFSALDLGDDLVGLRRFSFGVEALIKDPGPFKRHFPDTIVDVPTLEDIMLFYTKGDRS